jgi:hypothetical protein
MGWSATPQFDDFYGELVLKDGLDFQRAILPFLHIIDPSTRGTPPLSSGDIAGADFLHWSRESPLPLIVQAKGFRVPAHELGENQVKQCRKSIQSFARSGLRARRYWLIHNRDGRRTDFRSAVEEDLGKLMESGGVEEAVLLDVRQFILRAFDAMFQHVRDAFEEKRLTPLEPEQVFASQDLVPLAEIPFTISNVVITQRGLTDDVKPEEMLGDPAAVLSDTAQSRFSLLLGEFGFGKTTTALRALRHYPGEIHPLLVSAATIDPNTVGTRDFFRQCVNMEKLLADFPAEDRSILKKMARPAIERVLFDPKSNVVLIVDALDESAVLARHQGMQNFFNMLWATKVPIILTMRTEFWLQRLEDFSTFDGPYPTVRSENRRKKPWRVIELLPWRDAQIVELIARRIASEENDDVRTRLQQLKGRIEDGGYQKFYGDIPRRPLFLRMILDSVAEWGIQPTTRVGLFTNWITAKIRRDRREPMRLGGGRAPVLTPDEPLTVVQEAAWLAMEIAAAKMAILSENSLELTNSCYVEDVLYESRRLAQITDPTGMYLHSLLLPVASQQIGEAQRLRFAHRAFQEFFLARYIHGHSEKFAGIVLPESVTAWLREIESPNSSLT